ncbi:hypothetical protein [Rhodococcus kronopolitis]|uniref:DUF4352 domain-containing protein n=1 Tax=Rhodococcus kronopolitis TaxID=1460226 RepID=A0ABV9FRH1_9NOCA
MTGPNQTYPQQPPAKNKRRIWPWIVIGVPVLLFGGCTVAMVSAVGGDETATVSSGSSDGGGAAAANRGPEFPGKLAKDTSAMAGDTITRDGLAYTVTPLEQGSSVIGDYMCSNVTIKNVGDKQNDFNGYNDWSMQDANGAIRDASYAPITNCWSPDSWRRAGRHREASASTPAKVPRPEPTSCCSRTPSSMSSDRVAWINTI